MTASQETPNVEERLLAALAHGSVLIQGAGILVGVVLYVTHRDKSRFVALQALQAAVFQLIALLIIVGMWLCWGIFYGLSMIPLVSQAQANPDAAPPTIFWIGMGSMAIPFAIMIVIGLYGLWGALRAWQGRDFRYVLLGAWLERSGLWKTGEV